jgi:hypothetical protein
VLEYRLSTLLLLLRVVNEQSNENISTVVAMYVV